MSEIHIFSSANQIRFYFKVLIRALKHIPQVHTFYVAISEEMTRSERSSLGAILV